jgi:hypothetical protein
LSSSKIKYPKNNSEKLKIILGMIRKGVANIDITVIKGVITVVAARI